FVRVANTGLTGYGTWKSPQRTENTGFANALFWRKCLTTSETCDEMVRHPDPTGHWVTAGKDRQKPGILNGKHEEE
ncbi:MAG: hypothetical protein WAQ77_02435, partial [Candidatus Acidiferrum sp.]